MALGVPLAMMFFAYGLAILSNATPGSYIKAVILSAQLLPFLTSSDHSALDSEPVQSTSTIIMKSNQPCVESNTYEAAPQQDLDNRIRELTTQLAEARAEAAQYDQSRSQQPECDQKQPLSYTAQDYRGRAANNSSPRPGDVVPSSSRQLAPSPYPAMPNVPPPPYSADRLPLPVVLPQTSKAFRGAFYSPFVRAYVPELGAHGISRADFLTFIDGLNEAFIANPVFDGLNVAGSVMQQFYGLSPVQLAGLGVSVASGLASAATSFARTRAYVKAINANLFHPSGLHANIMTTKDMMAKVGHPEERLSLPPLDTNEQLDGSISKQEAYDSLTQISSEDARMRRVRALQGYVMPLDFNVPEVVTPDNLLKRMGNAQAKRQAKKQGKKDAERREKALEERNDKLGDADKKIAEIEKDLAKERRKMEKDMSKSKAQKEPKERAKIMKDFEKKERELNEDMEKALAKREKKIAKHGERGEEKSPKVEKREEKVANKIRWVVITVWEGESDEESTEDSTSLQESESGRK